MNTDNIRHKILIVDDMEVNRLILRNMLESDYDIEEAVDGTDALKKIEELKDSLDLILLDWFMPGKTGFEVLSEMSRRWWREDIPVIMISAEHDESYVVKAYKLGALDYIQRPFNAAIVRHRVETVMRLHLKEQRLAQIAANEIMSRHRNNNMMIHVLSGIVEFRNGESGMHVVHVQALTDMLMREIRNCSDKYRFTPEEMSLIPVAAAMHDIGKISVPSEILNKPGRLTDEEFAIMKKHTTAGYDMLNSLEGYRQDPLVRIAAQVCRSHHERWDGRGYPDGLKGDDIPMAAQLVSLADVYDALTSERCYKKAFSHEKTVEMIKNGECGNFNPVLLESFLNLADDIPGNLDTIMDSGFYEEDIQKMVERTLRPRRPD
ncbi:MAG: response regulator [Lachnospiraceae bacterium]|nr:response regulator [Lachnospiraceae bacterium]